MIAKAVAIETGKVKPTRADLKRPSVSGARIVTALEASGYFDRLAAKSGKAPSAPLVQAKSTQGCQNVFGGATAVPNFRVNQDCSLRRQAEENIAVNPTDSKNLIAGQNDSRVGFNHCGYDWTTDKGKSWGDQIPPFYQFALADGHTADACSDPTATFDNAGNAYVGGVLFDACGGCAASALVVEKSNAAYKGSFYHTPNSTLSLQAYRDNPLGVVESVDGTTVSEDKEFVVADASASSAKKNNVYMTWTRFTADNDPIYFGQSTDGGATWSTPVEISGSGSFCSGGFESATSCDYDQGSHPWVGPDGTVYVTFTNGNTPGLDVNQQLFVKCPVASNCSSGASWSAPTKVSDVFTRMPYGSVASTGCPGGRQCIPPNGYRVTSFTSSSVSADSSGKLYVSWFDGKNIAANCNPTTATTPGSAATATPPCDTDVWYSYSTDGGATWSAAKIVTPATAEGKTAGTGAAQWQPWSQVAPDGSAFYVGYYDRQYGTGTSYCETSGCNDITLATITNPATATPTIAYTRITSSSMPNLVATGTGANSLQAGFLGDYMWVATDSAGHPKLVWADTRPISGTTPEEDVYFAAPGDLPTSKFTVTLAGSGNGGVTSDPEGLTCTGLTCTGDFPYGSTVRLFPEPEANADFTGWGGDCTSSALGLCTKAMTQDYATTAIFEAVPPAKCIVPFVIGKTLKKAKAKITKAGCRPGKVTRAYSRWVKKGHVISTKPQAAKKVALGTKVKIKVSKGKR